MNNGIYTSASGGLLNSSRLDIVSNNLANVGTVGFKAQRLISRTQSFEETLANILPNMPANAAANFERSPGVVKVGTVTDFSQGPLKETGNPLDASLRSPNHFFAIQTDKGEAYTRAGNFTLDSEGNLVTQDGLPVLGDSGPINVGFGKPSIAPNGSIVTDGAVVARLKAVEFSDVSALKRTEGVRFVIDGNAQPNSVDAEVVPGALEMPNVSVVEAMVEMIAAHRAFEAYTKTVKEIDDLNDRAIRSARANG